MLQAKRGTSFLKRNGLKQTIFSSIEKRQKAKLADYVFKEPDICEKASQRREVFSHDIKFSILVPAYETKEDFCKEMIASCIDQTYENWELVIADASNTDVVKNVVDEIDEKRIKYVRVEINGGISDNTNVALENASGDYICLLDHDDLLAVDALYEFADVLEEKEYGFLYTDEDKCDETGTVFFEPHYKKNFNYDFFLSNNYICHFVAIKKEIAEKIRFRKEFDGAQDYDFFIQVVEELKKENPKEFETQIYHVPKILYHWRCHIESTASNPESKMYAYEAGRAALEAFHKRNGVEAIVKHGRHLGFYKTKYQPDIFTAREDVGAVGGLIYRKKHAISGPLDESNMQCIFIGLRKYFSGYMNQATCMQVVDALDIRKIKIRDELKADLEKIIEGLPDYERKKAYSDEMIARKVSVAFAKKIREKGYKLVFDPAFKKRIR
jgi:glycosyltransferase involved in cell wall biosynthesis